MVKIIISTKELHEESGSKFMDIIRSAGCTTTVKRTVKGKAHVWVQLPKAVASAEV